MSHCLRSDSQGGQPSPIGPAHSGDVTLRGEAALHPLGCRGSYTPACGEPIAGGWESIEAEGRLMQVF